MKQYFGNYLGLCVGNNDPEKRGRVQIFIPHIMPALFKDWNEAGEDIRLLCVGDNIPDSLPGPIVQKLTKMLPWAEAASPILGTSSPGSLVNNSFNQSPIIGAVTAPGGGTINNAVGGGTNGNWGGSLEKLSQIIPVGSWNPSSQKRGRVTTASGGTSDHYENNPDAYAVDLGLNSSFNGDSNRGTLTAIQIVNNVRSQRNEPPISSWDAYRGGKYEAVTPDGYRVQVIWQSQVGGNHNDHIHVGVKNELGQSRPTSIAQGQAPSLAPNSNGFETTSTSGSLAAGNPFTGPMPLDLGQGPTFAQPALESSPGSFSSITGPVQVDPNGRVNPEQLKAYLRERIASSRLVNFVPQDGAKYGVDGSVESWTNHFFSLAKNESSLYVTSTNRNDPGGSLGLFQVSVLDGSRYGANPTGQNWTEQQLIDPINNTNTAIAIYESNVLKTGRIADPTSGKGAWTGNGTESYFAAATMNKIAHEATTGELGSFDPNATPSMVTHTDPGGATSTLNINNMAKGVFTYPAAGALLWVFFREGDPLFPVYFAASFGQREWQSAFRQGSDAPGYKPTPTADNPIVSTGTVANFGVGGWRVEDTTDPNNPSNNQKSFMIYGHDGSNMFFNDGYHQLFTKFNRRDQVEGDRFQSTLGVKQDLVQSDSNTIVMGDQVVKVGNVTPDAVEAMDRIHSIIKDIMKPITQSNGPQVPKLPAATNKYLKKALEESFAKYGRPDTTPYSIPAKVALEGEQAVPRVEPITQVPITPPTPPSR